MEKRLYKSAEDRAISGVCGGIAEYFDIDSVIIRLLFVILTFVGVGIVAYIAAAVIMPERPYAYYRSGDGYQDHGQPVDDSGANRSGSYDTGENRSAGGRRGGGNAMLGVILIMAGAYLILRRYFYFLDMSFFMAGLLVLLGIMLIVRRR